MGSLITNQNEFLSELIRVVIPKAKKNATIKK